MKTFRSFFKLWPFIKGHSSLILISALLALPLAALRFGPVPLVEHLVDDLLVNKNATKLTLFPLLLIGIFTLNFIIRFIHNYMIRIVVIRVDQAIKNSVFGHLLGLSADYFTEKSTGTLIARIGNDPIYISVAIQNLATLFREPLVFAFLFGYTLYLNWKLTLIVLTVFPFLAWVFSATSKNMKRYIARMQDEQAKVFSSMQETFTGIRVVKSFRLEEYAKTKFGDRIRNFVRYSLKMAVLEEASHPLVELITAFALAGVVYVGGTHVLSDQMTSGGFLAFFAAFALMMDPLRRLNDINVKFSAGAASAARITEVLEWKANLHEPENPIPISKFSDSIEFENVRFAYPDAKEREVLKGISFQVRRGEIVALVGESGAGKSSLIGLLPRIYDITGGEIKIDGHDIREYTLDDLRKLIAVVTQDVFLFNDTIEQNIRCGKLDATKEEIREAARRAHALEFIEKIPNGFNAVIGDRGQKLSGGERQRLSIARAFLRSAPVLILDEATSSLDNKSERAVQAALEELMQNRTSIVIAHRLSTIQHADRIIVMKEGRILEVGKHDELMKNDGQYAMFQKMAQIQ